MADEFKVHKLNTPGLNAATNLAAAFDTLLAEVKFHVPPGRELALVTTKLQEACFWAKRGVAVLPYNQEE